MMLAHDTSPQAAAVQRRLYRQMGPKRRLLLALSLCDEARAIAEAGIRARHPDYTDEEVREALFVRLYGEPMPRKAFPTQESRRV